jgi:hypothetical protein
MAAGAAAGEDQALRRGVVLLVGSVQQKFHAETKKAGNTRLAQKTERRCLLFQTLVKGRVQAV